MYTPMVGEEVYIEPPREAIPDHHYVWKFNKGLNGLKSTSLRFQKFILSLLTGHVPHFCTIPTAMSEYLSMSTFHLELALTST
eukprot:4974178-Amphidinium_carterae.2